MLCALIFRLLILPLLSFSSSAYGACHESTFFEKKACQVDAFTKKDLLKLQEESSKKVETLLNDKNFQNIVAELKGKPLSSLSPQQNGGVVAAGDLYIFVSFSCTEKALINLAYEAKQFGATLVLKGFKEGSYVKTAQALQKAIQKTGQGFIIDPELFSLFSIEAIPTYVITRPFQLRAEERIQTPIHDRLQGHVRLQYALRVFAKEGDLKQEAKSLLLVGETK